MPGTPESTEDVKVRRENEAQEDRVKGRDMNMESQNQKGREKRRKKIKGVGK